ncbi:MAG: flagellar motor protein MotB [bacterium]|nr:flagellar motor protein MotB [bacterium]
MGRKKKGGAEEPGIPAWMVTYGDLMTLLLTFFVLLLSFSTISEESFDKAIRSVKRSLSVLPRKDSVSQIMSFKSGEARMPRRAERIARELRRMLQVLGQEEDVEIEYDKEGGLKINLPNRVLFDSAKADVKPEAYPILERLGEMLTDVPNKFIEVRGHTDNRPLVSTSAYVKDNIDLSYHRAKNVAAILNTRGGLPREEFEVVGCGEWQPVATNETDEGRGANRRVELQIRGGFDARTFGELSDMAFSLEDASGAEEDVIVPVR